jgi:hypothetical protein
VTDTIVVIIIMLPARERQLGRHEHSESGEGVVERVGDQAMGRNNAGQALVGFENRGAIFLGIQRLLRFERM